MSARKWLLALTLGLAVGMSVPALAGAHVLRVGSYRGVPGQFSSIQSAINAAKPGDWVLVGPGDYKTTSSTEPPGQTVNPAAVVITTPRLYLRGMNRNAVVVDGTKPGTPQCSGHAADQNYGPNSPGGQTGLNGIVVYKSAGDWVQNMTVCNFLGGAGGDEDTGNEVWWDGGHGSGTVGGFGEFLGSYLTATSDFYHDEVSAAEYGIYSSNWSGGPAQGVFDHDYASNFNDSGFYIGACQQICDQTMSNDWAENNALGYSGTNSGGQLVIENSQFDHNEDGFDTNSQNADFPPPMNGDCPNGGISPITHTHSCWVFMHNSVHDNNTPNVPTAGAAAAGPVGTGMSVAGARNVTVMDNTFSNNGAWGFIFVPYPDSNPQPCTGGTQSGAACIYDEYGDALLNNKFSHNGFFGNPTNGDYAATNLETGPTDCYSGNTDGGHAASSSPANLEQMYPTCNGKSVPPNSNAQFLSEVACDSDISLAGGPANASCLPTDHYPRQDHVGLTPLPSGLATMPNACSGVLTANPWCQGQVTRVARCAGSSVSVPRGLPVGERFVSMTVRVDRRRAIRHRARGAHTIVRFTLGRVRRAPFRVLFTARIRVGSHLETFSFTRIYQRCGSGRGGRGGHRGTGSGGYPSGY